MTAQQSLELKELGYTIIRDQIDKEWLNVLTKAVDDAFTEHRNIQIKSNQDHLK